jgi:23S rRNA pseudouridine2605 synthase
MRERRIPDGPRGRRKASERKWSERKPPESNPSGRKLSGRKPFERSLSERKLSGRKPSGKKVQKRKGAPRRKPAPPVIAAPGAHEMIRINRFLSMCGIASRRKAEELVLGGKVEVNHAVIRDLATRVDPARDRVFVGGTQAIPVQGFLYLVLNKPKDSITTLSDERGRTTVMSMIRTRERVYPVGRLDRNTTGVLLFTNDGNFAHRLMHPKYRVPKSYRVSCARALTGIDVKALRAGIPLEDGTTAPADVQLLPLGRGKEIGITIHEGRNRQVRRMFESLGYDVVKLDRVAYGPVTKEGLSRGGTRSLTRNEIRALKEMAGYTEEELLSGR